MTRINDGLTARQRYYYKNRASCLSYGKNYLKKWKKKNQEKVNSYATKNYRSFLGRLKKTYYGMKKRRSVNIISQVEFLNWSSRSSKYKQLYEQWKKFNFERFLAPSIDRINSNLGYTKNNIQWLTQSENTIKENNERRHQ